MKNRVKKQAVKSAEALSYSKVRRAFIVCLFLGILCFLLQNAFLAYTNMKQTVKTIQQSVSAQISEKVNESLKLLESLASLDLFYEPDTPWEEKVAVLDKINEFYGYMFICFVDQDIVVYTLGEEPASLASREHMQKVYASKQPCYRQLRSRRRRQNPELYRHRPAAQRRRHDGQPVCHNRFG